jgi:hypothetical protein
LRLSQEHKGEGFHMVAYIRSDLDFILAQIKIAEAHAAGQPLYGPGGLVPAYNVAWGLRTVDGTYNHLLPGQIEWGASDNEFPEHLGTDFKTIMVPAGPGGALVPVSYTPGVDNDGPGSAGPGDVFDPTVRIISNLLVDQTLGNPSAILTGLQRAGIVPPDQQMAVTHRSQRPTSRLNLCSTQSELRNANMRQLPQPHPPVPIMKRFRDKQQPSWRP